MKPTRCQAGCLVKHLMEKQASLCILTALLISGAFINLTFLLVFPQTAPTFLSHNLHLPLRLLGSNRRSLRKFQAALGTLPLLLSLLFEHHNPIHTPTPFVQFLPTPSTRFHPNASLP